MSYKSPIEITLGEFTTQIENDTYKVVQEYGIKVDRDELIKALEYDREQYEQGYADGQRDVAWTDVKRVEFENENRKVYKCQNCGQYMHRTSWANPVKYCSYCGKKINWDEVNNDR